MSRLSSAPQETPLTASQIEFAQQMLPFRYSEVVNLSSGSKNLLFATQEGGAVYSELHMAAGERSILRLSQEIAQLDGALVLIDEVEAWLHPWVQQLLMLQLQQLALRNDLQIIVTSHSPVVLDSVPSHGRIFLDRDETGRVAVRPPYRDIVQKALYGRSGEALNLLCEDETAEGILHGIFDFMVREDSVMTESIRIGRDTGADEFPMHAAAFKKFGQIQNFVFVLDGDKRDSNIEQQIGRQADSDVTVLFLPGREAPEIWVWDQLRQIPDDDLRDLGITRNNLSEQMHWMDMVYDSASDRTSQITKAKLRGLAEHLDREVPDICRLVARQEAERRDSDIRPLVERLESAFQRWRTD